jgi:DNA recombination protein RmuC
MRRVERIARRQANAENERLAQEKERRLEDARQAAERALEQGEAIARGFQGIQVSMERRLGGFDLQMERVASTLDRQLTANEQRVERMRATLGEGLDKLQESSARKLDEIRLTVGEKLDATLDKRLDASFRLVSERLEQVYKGLGEMRSLARGVDDLQKVMSNVKTRGVWGEMQLGAMLDQTLAPGQYVTNAQIKPNTQERVEFAVRMPGRGDGEPLLLPIDSKFPMACYSRVVEASGAGGDRARTEEALGALDAAIRVEARRIASKYIDPPHTTDFAILFLPLEALYAEALRRGDIVERVQREYKVIIAGPTTLFALLGSLQMGFRTLAIERRSHEVWRLLGAVRQEFGKFSNLLEATRAKIEQAGKSIDEAARKTRTIERRLEDVQEMDEGSQFALQDADISN